MIDDPLKLSDSQTRTSPYTRGAAPPGRGLPRGGRLPLGGGSPEGGGSLFPHSTHLPTYSRINTELVSVFSAGVVGALNTILITILSVVVIFTHFLTCQQWS